MQRRRKVKIVRLGRYVAFQMAEVAVPRELFQKILRLIDDLRRRPVPAEAEEIDGEVKSAREVRLNGGTSRADCTVYTPHTHMTIPARQELELMYFRNPGGHLGNVG